MIDTGYVEAASLDRALHEIEEECPDETVAGLLSAARMRYRLHEGSLAGIRHGSEEYRAWMAERKQVFYEMRRALSRVLAEAAL